MCRVKSLLWSKSPHFISNKCVIVLSRATFYSTGMTLITYGPTLFSAAVVWQNYRWTDAPLQIIDSMGKLLCNVLIIVTSLCPFASILSVTSFNQTYQSTQIPFNYYIHISLITLKSNCTVNHSMSFRLTNLILHSLCRWSWMNCYYF